MSSGLVRRVRNGHLIPSQSAGIRRGSRLALAITAPPFFKSSGEATGSFTDVLPAPEKARSLLARRIKCIVRRPDCKSRAFVNCHDLSHPNCICLDQAVTILEANPDIRVVLSDIEMPGSMDELRPEAAIRKRCPPIEITITSGGRKPALDDDTAVRAAFVPKPIVPGRCDRLASHFRGGPLHSRPHAHCRGGVRTMGARGRFDGLRQKPWFTHRCAVLGCVRDLNQSQANS